MSAVIDCLDSSYRVAELEDRAAQQTLAMASSLISLIDLRDRYTGGHSSRVARYCRQIALHMDLPHEQTEEIVLAAALHDIGKIGVPDRVLLKEGSLTDEEFEWIRKHPEFGWMAVRNVDGFQNASLMVLHHHERWDGNGYPGNLRGTEIPPGSYIIAVADSFDALTTDRPYRKGRTPEEALREICRCVGTQFNADAVRAFCDSMASAH
ncbi:MAG TPA: HD-GYP domain-containing protein [Terriglobia bacterium]|nr:HD-GYP domain-containing protein [Terriglobia bacterium]